MNKQDPWITDRLKRDGRSIAWLAEQTGIHPATLGRRLLNPEDFRAGELRPVARALGVSVARFLDLCEGRPAIAPDGLDDASARLYMAWLHGGPCLVEGDDAADVATIVSAMIMDDGGSTEGAREFWSALAQGDGWVYYPGPVEAIRRNINERQSVASKEVR